MKLFIFFLNTGLAFQENHNEPSQKSVEELYLNSSYYLKNMFRTMDLNIKPFGRWDDEKKRHDPLIAKVRVSIEHISSVDERRMQMIITFVLQQHWLDKRFARDPHLGHIHVPIRDIPRIWRPDIAIKNARHTIMQRVITDNHHMVIETTGDVFYKSELTSTVYCPMKLENYPMDTQVCTLSFSSFGHYSDELFLYWNNGSFLYDEQTTATITDFKLNGEDLANFV